MNTGPTTITPEIGALATGLIRRRPPVSGLSSETEIRSRNLLAQCCRDQTAPRPYLFRPEYRDIYRALTLWGLALEDTRLDCRKGIWLTGNIGVGKSTLMAAMREYCRLVRPNSAVYRDPPFYSSWRIVAAKEIVSAYQEGGSGALRQFIESDSLLIDDLGVEESRANHYGTQCNVIESVIMMRYNYRDTRLTHVTTNLDDTEILANYGERVYDRVREMFNIINLRGRSVREECGRMTAGG